MVKKAKVKSAPSKVSSWWEERSSIHASFKKSKPLKVKSKIKKVETKKVTKAKKVTKPKKVKKTK